MSTKRNTTGLAGFAGSPEPVSENSFERDRGKGAYVAMTMRLLYQDWERVRRLADADGISVNKLMLRGLDRMFAEKGLPGVTPPRRNDATAK